MKALAHIIVFLLLTVVTQIGGIIYLATILLVKEGGKAKNIRRVGIFVGLYLITTFLIIPKVAPILGREKIKETKFIQAHSFFYKLANRNYVRPELNRVVEKIAREFEQQNEGIKLIYLDANFPFVNKFPLLPHLSHNDGRKIDVALIYESPNGQLTNKKPSVSGYGVFEGPTEDEYNQISVCKQQGYWQYDYPKYLTLGRPNKNVTFSKNGTRQLIKLISEHNEVSKLFVEPHLKSRMNLTSKKIRFHGCQAVRHDDHIHFQIK